MDLFFGENNNPGGEQKSGAEDTRGQPLAARMRPQTLEDVAGQDHVLGPGKLLRRAIEAGRRE